MRRKIIVNDINRYALENNHFFETVLNNYRKNIAILLIIAYRFLN